MIHPILVRALREYGLRYNKTYERWEGADYTLCDIDLKDLSIADLDQVLAGVRDGRSQVSLTNGRPFKIR